MSAHSAAHGEVAVEASVVAGAVETVYRRAGHGPAVVVLVAVPWDSDGRVALGSQARLIVPVATTWHRAALAADRHGFAAWLGGFVDGLGIERVALVASADLVAEVEAYRSGHAEQVARVAWVPAAPRDWDAVAEALRDG